MFLITVSAVLQRGWIFLDQSVLELLPVQKHCQGMVYVRDKKLVSWMCMTLQNLVHTVPQRKHRGSITKDQMVNVYFQNHSRHIYIHTTTKCRGNWYCKGRLQWSSGSVLAIGPKIRGFKPEDDGFLMAIKSVAGLPSVPRREVYSMLKNPTSIKELLRRKIFSGHFSPFSCFATRCRSRALVENQEWLELIWGRTTDQKWSLCKGRHVRPSHTNNSNVTTGGTYSYRCFKMLQEIKSWVSVLQSVKSTLFL
jgi:hypothetical protein